MHLCWRSGCSAERSGLPLSEVSPSWGLQSRAQDAPLSAYWQTAVRTRQSAGFFDKAQKPSSMQLKLSCYAS